MLHLLEAEQGEHDILCLRRELIANHRAHSQDREIGRRTLEASLGDNLEMLNTTI